MSHKSKKEIASHKRKKGIVLQDIIFLIIAIFSVSFGLKSFLLPNRFLDGGITGLALLLHELMHWHLGLLLIVFNIPFIIISYKMIGKMFAIRMIMAVVGVTVCLQYLPLPGLTNDKLLVATFGGFFVGLGIGLCMRAGGAFDGLEVMAQFTLRRTGFTITEIILAFDVVIFFVAGFYLNVETALYAMLTYFVATQTTRYIIDGIEAYTGVTIISGESEVIKKYLVMKMNKGIMVYKGERGFMKESFETSTDCDIVFTVVTRLEVHKLKKAVYRIDPAAFIFSHPIKETTGGIVKEIIKH